MTPLYEIGKDGSVVLSLGVRASTCLAGAGR
jgi:hypothetical protein